MTTRRSQRRECFVVCLNPADQKPVPVQQQICIRTPPERSRKTSTQTNCNILDVHLPE
jgi:hypothetical protein